VKIGEKKMKIVFDEWYFGGISGIFILGVRDSIIIISIRNSI
jgi:hypothetical protein